jgi:phage gp36-like protein
MAYCSVEDVRLMLKGTLGDVPAAADKLETEQIEAEIDNAQAEVDAALSNMYIVPLTAVPGLVLPDVIKYITRDIAAYLCDLTFRMSKEYGGGANPIRLRYSRAKDLLNGLLNGKYVLDVPEDARRSTGSEVFNPYEGDLITVEHLFGSAVYG